MSLRIAVLVFALTFAVGAAFAATNGMLAFGGTVRINSAVGNPDPVVSLEFVSTNASVSPNFREHMTAASQIVTDADGNQMLNFDINILDLEAVLPQPGATGIVTPAMTSFGVRNTGDVPVRLIRFIPPPQSPGTHMFHVSYSRTTILPGQSSFGIANFCSTCLNTFLTRNEVEITYPYVSLNFSFLIEYEVAPDTPVGASDVFTDIVEPMYCEVF